MATIYKLNGHPLPEKFTAFRPPKGALTNG